MAIVAYLFGRPAFCVRTARLLPLLALALAIANPARAEAPQLKVGQTYRCSGENLPGSVLAWVGKIDVAPLGGKDVRIVSISLIAEGQDASIPVGHAPFADTVFAECRKSSADFPQIVSAAFDGGYATWREAFDKNEAGIWKLSPAEAYWTMLGVLNQ
ncbi:hypothetical protein [Frigidibacter sp. SD6-1]|uniref:hypothetical protein n=1 Tax=Frigidibacter sp. SD6-1 TaxID=3032581 RepID=UPI0024DF315E|nr:hypothetical protein [Frigidibacter sp. SD6-1]